ncbi:SDR family NAD(P)-dependent oxidoreductase, partial [Klebsiella pneumoniae]|uniref:SDR family NAD(P)-dependent oxidoreductase n=1 Tax=Klebsiella pneumoniae TaxID=573 RepID=UPI0027308B1B
SLSDRVFVVTGGFGALGRALAAVLLEEGARVALLDRAPARVGLPDGDRVLTIGGADLGDAGAAAAAFAQVRQRWQRIDGLVNVAGGFAWETV